MNTKVNLNACLAHNIIVLNVQLSYSGPSKYNGGMLEKLHREN